MRNDLAENIPANADLAIGGVGRGHRQSPECIFCHASRPEHPSTDILKDYPEIATTSTRVKPGLAFIVKNLIYLFDNLILPDMPE